jgi:hypothetical protein
MSQLYASLRLYAADEGGAFPYYNRDQEDDTSNDDGRGIGLWALYTFPLETDADKLAPVQPAPDSKPIERYLRSANVLHCPADFDAELEDGTTVNRESLFLPDPDTPTQRIYNPDYISYHSFDNGTPDDDGDDVSLYASFRLDRDDPKPTSVSGLERWRRQLLHYDDDTFINRRPTDDTVVTWCPWHRGVCVTLTTCCSMMAVFKFCRACRRLKMVLLPTLHVQRRQMTVLKDRIAGR